MVKVPATKKKLREARFFLQHLQRRATAPPPADPEDFEFFLSAFLSAARSVTFALQNEENEKYNAWFPAWRDLRDSKDQDLLKFMNDQRVSAVHRKGADVSLDWEYIPMTEVRNNDRSHPAYGFHYFAPPGTPVPKVGRSVYYFELGGQTKAVDTCTRYLALLDDLVNGFVQAHR